MKRKPRGMALIIVLVLMVVFIILIGGLLDALALESQNLQISDSGNTALHAAYAGVDAMVLQTEQWYTGTNPGPAPTSLPTYQYPQDPTGQQVEYKASIVKEWHATGLAYYLIDAVGTVTGPGGPCGTPCLMPEVHTREVKALVRQRPFTHYGLFVVSERSNVGGPVWYTYPLDFEGPVYSGGPMHIMYEDGAPQPIFGSTVDTTTLKPPQWINTSRPNGPNKPQNATDWAGVIAGGQADFHLTNVAQTLPSFADNLLVASEAYYGDSSHTSGLPSVSKNEVYVNGANPSNQTLQTGIYVQGDALLYTSGDVSNNTETLEFRPDPTSQSTIPNDVTILVNFNGGPGGNGMTTVTESSGSTVLSTNQYDGVPSGLSDPSGSQGNGAIFADGSLTVRGSVVADPSTHIGQPSDGPASVHGKYDIAVQDNINSNSDTIMLTDSLTYADGGVDDELALWANNIVVKKNTDGDIEVDGLILTGYAGELNNDGTLKNYYCHSGACSGGMGTLTLKGSLVENIRGKLGTVGPRSGYSRLQQYDPRLGANPPPFSPTTNQFEVVALFDNGGSLLRP